MRYVRPTSTSVQTKGVLTTLTYVTDNAIAYWTSMEVVLTRSIARDFITNTMVRDFF